MIHVIGPKNTPPKDAVVINTTSRSNDFGRGFSPFFLGPVELWGGHSAYNVENAWQYSKAYDTHLNQDGSPNETWLPWAKQGWGNPKAVRYPMGKGVNAACSFWDGKRLTYTQARREIYIPLYAKLVVKTEAYRNLSDNLMVFGDIYLWDFDGYDHRSLNMTYDAVIDCPYRKMGHAFVIAMLIDGHIKA
jgi:hypothetical protein